MALPSNGITPDIIREVMPPYHLDQDLLTATFACIAPPPPDATPTQRRARITRLIAEIADLNPANAAQARIAAQILITRELTDTVTARACAPDLPLAELCCVARSTAELQRSATALERTLARHQQKPVPFFGTVIQDQVDVAALDASWAHRPPHAAAPTPTLPQAASPQPATTPLPPEAPAHSAPSPASSPASSSNHEAPHTRPAAPGSDWTITRLDSGPGWTREVLGHRSATQSQAAE